MASLTKTERLLALAELLRARRTGITAGAIAEHFDVTVRTVHRDLEALRAAHLPISSERGRGGGFALDASYTLPPVNFTAREAAVMLTLFAFAEQLRLLPFQNTLRSGRQKLRAALSTSAQRELARRLETLGFVGVPSQRLSPGVADAVEAAWMEQTPISLLYSTRDQRTRSVTVHIRGIVFDRSETRINVTDAQGREWQAPLQRFALPRASAC